MPGGDDAEARRLMQAARALTAERFPYLDTALYSMVLRSQPGLNTCACDARWRIYYDPERVLAHADRMDVLVADWYHELGHLLRDHHARWDDLKQPTERHPVFNTAGDALINADMRALDLTILPTDITFDRLPEAAGASPDMTTEHIYRLLLEHIPESPRSDCGSGAGGERRDWEEPIDDGSAGVADDGSVDAGRAELIQVTTAQAVCDHVRRNQGFVPAGLRRWAGEIAEPAVDWRRELRAQVSRAAAHIAGRTDYAWTQPSRRRVPGYLLPGMVAQRPPSIVAVIDTSASMTPEDLGSCLAEIQGLQQAAAGGSRLRVIACDAVAHGVQSVRNVVDVELLGGGGTDMVVGIDRAAGLRPTADVVVVLTDGYTEWPQERPAENPRAAYIAVLMHDGGPEPPGWIQVIRAGR